MYYVFKTITAGFGQTLTIRHGRAVQTLESALKSARRLGRIGIAEVRNERNITQALIRNGREVFVGTVPSEREQVSHA